MTITDIRRELAQRGNPAKYEKVRYYFNHTTLKMYGASTVVHRGLAKQWTREHKDVPARDVIALASALYFAPSFDEKLIASYILGLNTSSIPDITEAQWSRWIKEVDNWAVSDNISGVPLGTWVLADPVRGERFLRALIQSHNIWARRIALVALSWLNRKQESKRLADLAFLFVRRTMHERDIIITKAVSWVLRELIRYHPRRVADFLRTEGDDLPAIARREAMNKLTTGKKSGKA